MIKIAAENFKIDETFYLSKLEEIVKDLGTAGNIVIKLGDKAEAKALNFKYLKRDYPTDVLSFPCNEEMPDGFYLGDVFICCPMAGEQAEENGITVEQELFTLMVHGILHLTGKDHETDEGEMEKLQENLIEKYFYREET